MHLSPWLQLGPFTYGIYRFFAKGLFGLILTIYLAGFLQVVLFEGTGYLRADFLTSPQAVGSALFTHWQEWFQGTRDFSNERIMIVVGSVIGGNLLLKTICYSAALVLSNVFCYFALPFAKRKRLRKEAKMAKPTTAPQSTKHAVEDAILGEIDALLARTSTKKKK
ncbi:MAG: hypothetical protein K0R63_762 [Rickettsiales bacterium]|jgi:disulfide bond formation protein DsbB|nr:hypothetical protein [Rickettsiales bacterium]